MNAGVPWEEGCSPVAPALPLCGLERKPYRGIIKEPDRNPLASEDGRCRSDRWADIFKHPRRSTDMRDGEALPEKSTNELNTKILQI